MSYKTSLSFPALTRHWAANEILLMVCHGVDRPSGSSTFPLSYSNWRQQHGKQHGQQRGRQYRCGGAVRISGCWQWVDIPHLNEVNGFSYIFILETQDGNFWSAFSANYTKGEAVTILVRLRWRRDLCGMNKRTKLKPFQYLISEFDLF